MESFLFQKNMAPAVISSFSLLIALLSLYFTYSKNKIDKQLSLDKDLFDAAVIKLESAFEILTKGRVENRMVNYNRSNWIMAAREIEQFELFKSKIITENYKMILNSTEEYWSHKFYEVVGNANVIPAQYYKGLHAGSVIVVYVFATWNVSRKCLLDEVDYKKLIESSNIFQGRYGLLEYIKEDSQFSHLTQL